MSEQQYDNKGRGVLFRNEQKNKDDERAPDYTGNLTLLDGTECFLDAWLRTSKKGTKFMSVRYKPKMAREHRGAAQNPPAHHVAPDFNDDPSDIPF